jgi:hypothetical protein
MKNLNLSIFKVLPGVIALLGALFLLGCGTSNTSTNGVSATTGSCSTGYLYSATYGCLAEGSCSSGYALYNNSCVYVGTTTTTSCSTGYTYNSTYGCLYTGTTTTTTYQGSCTTGYVQTLYGCLVQGTCPSGYGYAYGMCYKSTLLN